MRTQEKTDGSQFFYQQLYMAAFVNAIQNVTMYVQLYWTAENDALPWIAKGYQVELLNNQINLEAWQKTWYSS